MGKSTKREKVGLHQLTPREREALGLLASGLSSARIAARMKTSVKTTRTHVQNILRKTGLHSRLQLVVRFLKASARA